MIKNLTPKEVADYFTQRVCDEVNAYFERYALIDRLVLSHFVPFWQLAIGERHWYMLAYLDKAGLMQGAFGGAVYPNIFSGKTDAHQVFWHMLPEGKGHGIPLLKAFEQLAKRDGAQRIFIHHPLLDKPQEYRETFEHWGYRPSDVNYEMIL